MRLDDSAGYQAWLAAAVRDDLAESVRGFGGSPVKAGLDILRDLRDLVRRSVDFGALTRASLDEFYAQIIPQMNRAVVGPQFERHTELLALMSAGIAATPFGPAPEVAWDDRAGRWRISSTRLAVPAVRDVDWLASGHFAMPAVDTSASPLLVALHRRGLIRRISPASRYVPGVELDRDHHPLDSAGAPVHRLWVLGLLTEGSIFYNNLVPSPGAYSRPLADAHRCVTGMFAADRVLVEPG
jgi:hypothetical protein